MAVGRAILVLLLAVIATWTYNFVPSLGIGRVVYDHSPGPCHLVAGVEDGSEDIQILDDNTALITSGLRDTEPLKRLKTKTRGQVFLFDFTKPKQPATAVNIIGLDLHTFNPHGISTWSEKNGTTTVFIVNHPLDSPGEDRVEVFTWDAAQKTLAHKNAIRDEKFRVINNLVPTSASSFYISNFKYMAGEYTQLLETLSYRAWGQVLYYNGQQTTVVADRLAGANGLALSPDKQYLYVAIYDGMQMQIYQRVSDDKLQLRNTVNLGTNPDNLIVDNHTGDIWIGCQPIMWQVMGHLTDGISPAASQVLRLKLSGTEVDTLEEVFADSGRILYGSSAAAYRKEGLLIGTMIHKLMYCKVLHLEG